MASGLALGGVRTLKGPVMPETLLSGMPRTVLEKGGLIETVL